MHTIFAISVLAWRNAFRSRVGWALALLPPLAAALLPLGIHSDGTATGLIRLHLTYSIGVSVFLLTLASLWLGCAAISQEAETKTLHLLLVKPVPRLFIWLGKWLALLAMNALLLGVAGGLSLLTLNIQLHRSTFPPEDLQAARAVTLASFDILHSPLPEIEAEVAAEYARQKATGRLPDAPPALLMENIRRALLVPRFTLPPDRPLSWTFQPSPFDDDAGPAAFLRFRCDSSLMGATESVVEVLLNGQSVTTFHFIPGTPQQVPVDLPSANGTPLTVTLKNHDPNGATLFFEPVDGLTLLQPHGGFAGNYLRALSQSFLRLALFAAIGVTLGTLFSMPVAAFLSLVLLLLMQLSGFVGAAAQTDRATFVAAVSPFGATAHSHADDADEAAAEAPSLWARGAASVLYYTYRGTWAVLRPVLETTTLDRLVNATRIPPRELAGDLLRQGLLLPLALALVSTAVLRRREWALPPRT